MTISLSSIPSRSTASEDFATLAREATADPQRLAAVRASGLVEDIDSSRFADAAALAAELLDAPFGFVTVLEETRCHWKATSGLPDDAERGNTAEESFCQYVAALRSELLVEDARDDPRVSDNPSIESMGLVAWAGHPVRAPGGQVIGTLCVADLRPRRWNERDATVLRTLARSVSNEVARMAAAHASLRSLRRSEALSRLAQRLGGATTSDEVAQIIVDDVPPAVDAVMANLALLSFESRTVTVCHSPSVDPEIRERYSELPLDLESPLTECIRTGNEVWVTAQDRSLRYPHLVEDTASVGLTTTASLPVLDSDGSVLGAVGVGWSGPIEESDELESRLRTVVTLCAQSIRRAQLAGAQTDLIGVVREHLLPPVPDVEGVDVAVRYLPANNRLGLGGDWYDLVPVGSGRLAVVVGDVAGHGIEATARMLSIQSVLNTLVRVSWPAEDLFRCAEMLLDRFDEPYLATAAVLVLDLEGERVAHLSAGHPPAVIRTPDGTVTPLEGGRRRLLGLPGPSVTPEWVPLPAGSTLVAYTDGLIERPRESFDVGFDRLCAHLAEQPGMDAGGTADDLLGSFGQTRRRDDIALVVLRTVQ